ncbi:hypothetical protein E4U28_002529, partial [Claviceps purpurea]
MVKEAVSEAFIAPPPQRGRRSWPVAPRPATQPGPNAVFTHASSSRNVTTVSPLWRRRAATAIGAWIAPLTVLLMEDPLTTTSRWTRAGTAIGGGEERGVALLVGALRATTDAH